MRHGSCRTVQQPVFAVPVAHLVLVTCEPRAQVERDIELFVHQSRRADAAVGPFLANRTLAGEVLPCLDAL